MRTMKFCLVALIICIVEVIISDSTVISQRYRDWNNVQDEVENTLRNFLRRIIKPKSRWRYHHEHHRPESRVNLYDNPWYAVPFTTTIRPTSPPLTITPTPTTEPPTLKPVDLERPNLPTFPRFPNRVDRNLAASDFAEKPGLCPEKPQGPWVCSSRCSLDSDCRGTKKCCKNRCGAMACIAPIKPAVEAYEYSDDNKIEYIE